MVAKYSRKRVGRGEAIADGEVEMIGVVGVVDVGIVIVRIVKIIVLPCGHL